MRVNFKKFLVVAILVIVALVLLSCINTNPSPSPAPTPLPVETIPLSPEAVVTPVPPSPTPKPTFPAIATPVPSPTISITLAPSPTPIIAPITPAATFVVTPLPAKTVPSLEVVASGLEVPWSLAFAPDGRLFFTERPGRLRVIQQGKLLEEPVARLDVAAVGEGGLMGLALDPAFPSNGFIYIQYTYRDATSLKNRVERLTLKDNKMVESKVIIEGIPGGAIHDGGRVKLGPDGKLYIPAGEAGNTGLSQDLGSLGGKILRLNRDGSIPADNPFPGSPVYSYGHRNPEGLAWQPVTNVLFSTEHGSSAHDEVNIIRAGGNYGWPLVRGTGTSPGLIAPLLESGEGTWAPSGMAFYQGAAFPQWKGNLFFTALRGEHLHRLVLDGQQVIGEERLFEGELGRLRDVIEGPDGFLYFSTSNRDGRGRIRPGDDHIYRLVP